MPPPPFQSNFRLLFGQVVNKWDIICFFTAHDPVDATAPFLLGMRQSLAALPDGEEVLARWSDEGWYYRGIVRHDCGDHSYLVEDSVGDLERIWREDIIADMDDADNVLQVTAICRKPCALERWKYFYHGPPHLPSPSLLPLMGCI